MSAFKLFLLFLLIGFLFGCLFGVLTFIKKLFKNNIVISNILNFLFVTSFGFVVMLSVIEYNFGEFRFYLIAASFFGLFLERKTLGKIFAKLYLWLYNKLCKVCCALSKTKVVKKILK